MCFRLKPQKATTLRVFKVIAEADEYSHFTFGVFQNSCASGAMRVTWAIDLRPLVVRRRSFAGANPITEQIFCMNPT